jgi:hypothetical protein
MVVAGPGFGALVIAGPVFPEWYWGPIFFLVMFSPLLAGGTTALYLGTRPVARRRGWHRRPAARALHLVLSFVLITLAILLAGAVWRRVTFERAEARDARQVRYATFEPRAGAGFHATRAEVFAGTVEPSVHWTYERDGASFFAVQTHARRVDLTSPSCNLGPAFVTRYGGFDGPCTPRRTPGGHEVLLAREAYPPHDRYAFALRGETLVALSTLSATDADLLAYVDALQPVDPRDIDYKP